jgi:glycosyltransferase involved in cell wall biosynthesis
MTISVIIPVYNGSFLLSRCLDSVFSQKGEFELEVICIDDGSTDNSIELIKKINQPIKLIKQSNKGQASARNKGIKEARGEFTAFLDADDYWLPDFLLKTTTFLNQYKDVVAVNTGQKHILNGKEESIIPAFLENNSSNKIEPFVLDNFFKFWAEHNHVCTGSVLMRTAVVKKTGGQIEKFRISQDLEFWGYMATFGDWGFIPEVLFVADGGKVTRSIGFLKKYMIRWESTPSINEFISRILPNLKKNDLSNFYIVIGKIAVSFTYCNIMSKKFLEASILISEFGEHFPKSKQAILFKLIYNTPLFLRNNLFRILRIIQIIKYKIKFI